MSFFGPVNVDGFNFPLILVWPIFVMAIAQAPEMWFLLVPTVCFAFVAPFWFAVRLPRWWVDWLFRAPALIMLLPAYQGILTQVTSPKAVPPIAEWGIWVYAGSHVLMTIACFLVVPRARARRHHRGFPVGKEKGTAGAVRLKN